MEAHISKSLECQQQARIRHMDIMGKLRKSNALLQEKVAQMEVVPSRNLPLVM